MSVSVAASCPLLKPPPTPPAPGTTFDRHAPAVVQQLLVPHAGGTEADLAPLALQHLAAGPLNQAENQHVQARSLRAPQRRQALRPAQIARVQAPLHAAGRRV